MRYEKGRKDSSRTKIVQVASERFRNDGIAASGLATIMSDAGLTNGAFYPHFGSKADLVRECMAVALDTQTQQICDALASGGLELAISSYLSAAHRDNPAKGCTSAALLSELARQPPETRQAYTEHFMSQVRHVAAKLPPMRDQEDVALSVFATLIGTLQLARAVEDKQLSDRILAAGKDAARRLIEPHQKETAS